MNIKLSYLYRDAGNFKEYGEVIFSNPNNLSISLVSDKFRSTLLYGLYFIAHEVNIPDLRPLDWNDELDHLWHELGDVSLTADASNEKMNRSIDEFLVDLLNSQPTRRF